MIDRSAAPSLAGCGPGPVQEEAELGSSPSPYPAHARLRADLPVCGADGAVWLALPMHTKEARRGPG